MSSWGIGISDISTALSTCWLLITRYRWGRAPAVLYKGTVSTKIACKHTLNIYTHQKKAHCRIITVYHPIMSKNFSTIAIIGATSGLGEGFVRRFHAQGKTVIATGRRIDRLQALQKELSGLEIQQMDVSDIATLPDQVSKLLSAFPKIDTVMAMAGIQKSFDFKDPKSSTPQSIAGEVTTNVTAPMILAPTMIPHLLAQKRPTTFILVSSGLAFVPMPMYPVYCPTKAAVHAFAITLRGQLLGTSCNVIELAPPYVDTGLDAEHRESVVEKQGGEEKAVKPMPLDDYLDGSMKSFEQEGIKEIGMGFSQMGVDAWRGAFGPIYKGMGMDA